MVPPVAPTPRRFLFDEPKRKSAQENEQNSTSVNRRQAFVKAPNTPASTTPGALFATTPMNKRRQFASTPKFALPTPNSTQAPALESTQHWKPQFQVVVKPPLQSLTSDLLSDSIDDAFQNVTGYEDELTVDQEPIDCGDLLFDAFESNENQTAGLSRSPVSKRPRLSDALVPSLSHPSQLGDASASASTAHAAHRFLENGVVPTIEVEVQERLLISKRQAFFRSSSPVEGQPDVDPLPIQFSPHRKGQKFEPGGLAATMRSHIMELTSSESHQSNRKTARWSFKVGTIEAETPFALVHGSMEDGKVKNFILAGSRMPLQAGCTVHVQGMTWSFELAGQNWIVCIDWKAIK